MLCCDRLQNRIAAAGQRGIAVVVRRVPEFYIFYLQSRAVTSGEEETFRQQRIEQRVNLISSVGIQFCPWCGARLDDVAAAAPEAFSELAKQHEPLVPEV